MQSIFSNLKIIIHDGYEAELQFENSSGQTLNILSLYMNDIITCHATVFDGYFNSDINVMEEVLTQVIGASATAMIRVNGQLNKISTTINSKGVIDFDFEVPYVDIPDEESVVGEFQILIIEKNGDKRHSPIIDRNIAKQVGDIYKAVDNKVLLQQYLKEKERKEYIIEPDQLSQNDQGKYEIILKHGIQSCDGNIFCSVLGEDKTDRTFTKMKISDTELKIIVLIKEKLYIALRK